MCLPGKADFYQVLKAEPFSSAYFQADLPGRY